MEEEGGEEAGEAPVGRLLQPKREGEDEGGEEAQRPDRRHLRSSHRLPCQAPDHKMSRDDSLRASDQICMLRTQRSAHKAVSE